MKIAIIGCGYIGKELAKNLSQNHFVVSISNNADEIKSLSNKVQKSIVIKENDEYEISLILQDNDVIIVTLEDVIDLESVKMAQIIKKCAISMSSKKRLIYTSKSQIYGDQQGMWVDEAFPLKAKDEESKILIDIESTFYSLIDLGWDVTILRMSKIYGHGRSICHLFKIIYKSKMTGHGEYFTNMVHIDDVVGITNYVIDHDILGIFNVVDDDHPTRQEFANQICTILNLLRPKFDPKLADYQDYNKRISNYRIKEKGYIFKYPHRIIEK